MMPCKVCDPNLTLTGRGIRQVGKARYDEKKWNRRYVCQDCGATCVVSGDPRDWSHMREQWYVGGTQVADVLVMVPNREPRSLKPRAEPCRVIPITSKPFRRVLRQLGESTRFGFLANLPQQGLPPEILS